jgi:hypothetical protein
MELRTYRAEGSAYAVFAVIAAGLAGLWGAAMWRAGAPWQPLCIPLGGFALAATWLARHRLGFGREELVVGRPFARSRRLALSEIVSVELARETDATESPFVISIRTSGGEELRLNAKVYAREAVQRLLDLRPQAPRSSSNKARGAAR